jgi:hypothetical protein
VSRYSSPRCGEHDRLDRHPAGIAAEPPAKFLLQRINDAFRIDAAARPDLVDQRVTKDRRTREVRDVGELPLLPDHGNADISEACCNQQLLDRIDLVAGERHAVELRRIGREEARRYLMRETAKRIVSM